MKSRADGEQREKCIPIPPPGFVKCLDRLLGVLDVGQRNGLGEGGQMVVVGTVTGLLQVAEGDGDRRDTGLLQTVDQGPDMLMSSPLAPGDLGAHRLHIAVPEGSRQL